MDDDLHRRIEDLVEQEHALRRQSGGDGLDDTGHAQLRALEESLDRTWDLLRQRDARRAAGQDPGLAAERSAGTVEGYLE